MPKKTKAETTDGPIFDEEFFKKLKEFIDKTIAFIKQNWFWSIVILIALTILIFVQQLFLWLLSGAI